MGKDLGAAMPSRSWQRSIAAAGITLFGPMVDREGKAGKEDREEWAAEARKEEKEATAQIAHVLRAGLAMVVSSGGEEAWAGEAAGEE